MLGIFLLVELATMQLCDNMEVSYVTSQNQVVDNAHDAPHGRRHVAVSRSRVSKVNALAIS